MADEAEMTDTQTSEATTETAPANDAPVDTAAADESTVLGGGAAEADAGEGEAEGGDEAAVTVPDAYDLTAPEGMTLDADAVTAATPVFKELGLTNEQANKLMPVAGEFAQRVATQAIEQHETTKAGEFATLKAQWASDARADAELGGDWDQTTTLAAKGLDMLGFPAGSSFRVYLEETGLGNHPEMIRAMRRVGERVSEDGFVRAETVPTKVTAERAFYSDAFQPRS